MSVIAGIYRSEEAPFESEERDHLLQAMERYPGSGTGEWEANAVWLACRHQWIAPESPGEQLPRYDASRRLAITADAILDNREELFERLGISRDRRRTLSDNELILLAYERWGAEAPSHLNGDFAFVIWDAGRRRLFGARDPLGNRTLYFTASGGRFAFCTAIRPLLALPGVSPKLDEDWLSEYMAIPSMLDAASACLTVYGAIRQLPPAHRLTLALPGQAELSSYGSLAPTERLRFRTDAECVEAFRDVFRRAVRAKIRTGREVGASLSGGLDSGAVVSYAAKALEEEGKILHTYSCVPPNDFVDWTSSGCVANERPFIEATVRHIGHLDAHILDLPDCNPFTEIDELLDIREMPYKAFENAFWIKALYAQAERQGVGVLLTGAQGNHTISWGPAIDYYARLLKRLRWLKLYRELRLYSRRMRVGRSRLLPVLGKEAAASLIPLSFPPSEPAFPSMIHPDFAARTKVYDRIKHEDVGLEQGRENPWRLRERHFDSASIGNLIGTSGAKFSINFGLWERDPTADHRVIRFCLALPTEQYVRGGMDRALVRRATEGVLPDHVRLNQRLRGVQGVDWVHRMRGHWPAFLLELRLMCKDSLVAGILNVPQAAASLARIGDSPRPELAMDDDARFLMRCLIVYRFLKRVS